MENEASTTTKVYKSHSYGWQADTEIELDSPRVLKVQTFRSGYGPLTSSCSVMTRQADGKGMTHVFGGFDGDYSAVLLRVNCPRVTEKAVRAQHEQALAGLPQILADVQRHYAHIEAERSHEHA